MSKSELKKIELNIIMGGLDLEILYRPNCDIPWWFDLTFHQMYHYEQHCRWVKEAWGMNEEESWLDEMPF